MSKFSEQVHISISSFEKNVIYYDLELSQKMADHHYFSFVWQYTGKAVIDPEDQAKAISKYVGSDVIFTFKVNDVRLMSKGIISGIKSIDLNGSPAGLHVSGVSHTIALDDMKKSRIFLNKNLQQIALEIFAEESSGEFYQREAITPAYTKPFIYKPQYNETSFDFVKRLATRHGEWFYFDGMRMQFGQTKTSKVKLINGSSLHKFTIEANLVSHKTSFGGYDYSSAANIRNAADKTAGGSRDRFAVSMGFNQGSIARKDLSVGTYTNNAQNKEEIDEMIKLQTAGKDANSVFYSGVSYLPIGVGQVFSIQNKTVEHELIAVEVMHHSEVNGNYSCDFRAIPADVEAPHYTDVTAFAVADSQSAKVIDNNDPEQLGRIKVQYYWNGWGNESDWIRVVQSYAGSDKGNYFRPEIGEEVRVGFEGGNAECPYVSGSYYNGKEKPEFFDSENMIKGWKLRFGMLFKFVEKVGIWLSDPSGNELHLDEEGKNITITTPETLTLNCKNLIINASESITTTAGVNIFESAGVDKSTMTGMMHTLNVGGDSITNVTGELHEIVEGNRNSTSKKSIAVHDDFQMNVAKDKKIHSKGDLHVNSGENTNMN
ncbi:type VI secretion system Vgr family protein [Flavobacterium sp. KJJ]|uniref:type VI secretion system Vgr family protein n=1 Tax=Flavobacterium sp. KJJ TaxID=1270193 RepID=UPI0004938480|nr:phage baseplate assembly protein V [Flavobacterium sp. KJJ]